MNIDLLKQQLCEYIDNNKKNLFFIADELHAHPELGEQEFFAKKLLTTNLQENGFHISENLANLPTSFLGQKGNGPIHIGFLAEYDALPEMGHACGHNLIAMMSIGAAYALSFVCPQEVTTYIYGCPAEETIGGKVFMADAGVFDGLHAAMIVHPDEVSSIGGTSYATHPLEVTFYGKPAHIASKTNTGINALDALIEFYVNLKNIKNELTEPHILGGIITNGGIAPNIIPDKATMQVAVRALDEHYLEKTMLPLIYKSAHDIAAQRGCTVTLHHYEPLYKDLRNEPIMDQYFANNLTLLGEPYTVFPKDYATGSTDVGNVSHVVRTIHPTIKIGSHIDAHTPEFAAAAASLEGKENALKGAKAMAMTAIDIITEYLNKK